MNPFALFVLGILSPALLAVTLLVPPYIGIAAAAYIVYDTGQKTHPLENYLYDVFYMIDVYTQLLLYWTKHIAESDLLHYTLPVIALPLLGIMLALWLTAKVTTKLKTIFQLGSSF